MFLPLALCFALVGGGCTSTFLVSKDCKTYFFGSNYEALYRTLCPSGDLEMALRDAQLPQEIRDGLYKAQCADRSREGVNRIYASLPPDQQENLKSAFRTHGYQINTKSAPNFRYYDFDYCPSGY